MTMPSAAIKGFWWRPGEPEKRWFGVLEQTGSEIHLTCHSDTGPIPLVGVNASKEMIKLLGPKDFETLVDLIFSISGWRRQGIVGKTQKTLDLDLSLPSTGERAFVQVKSKTTSAELVEYVESLNELDSFNRMFFVYHSGEAETDDERVIVIGPDKLSEMAVDAGLVTWLIRKVS